MSDNAFRSLDLVVRRRLDGLLQGRHTGLRLGPGSDVEEVVRYRPGEDEVRRIDWNVTARSGQPHVWRTRSEHELETWLLLDRTPSMDFGTGRWEKADLAGTAAAAVGLLTDAPGNRLGVLDLTADGLAWLPARPGRVTARSILRTGPRARTTTSPIPDPPDLVAGLRALERRARRPGLRVIVSDFVDAAGTVERPFPWEPALRRVAARHDVLVLEIVDPRELELPDVGHVLLTDPETGRQREVWTSPDLRRRYAELAAGHRAAVAEAVVASGAGHVRLRTDTDWVRELTRYIRARRRVRPRSGRTPR